MTAEVPLKVYQKYIGEGVLLGFDFERFADAGVTITGTPTISITKMADVPGSANGDITPTLGDVGGSLVNVDFSPGGILGERYLAAVKADLSDGQVDREIRIYIYIKRV